MDCVYRPVGMRDVCVHGLQCLMRDRYYLGLYCIQVTETKLALT